MTTPAGMRQKHKLADRQDDLYETAPEAVLGLLHHLQSLGDPLPERVWEPCCGPGEIVRVLAGKGYQVTASDLVDYSARWKVPGVSPQWRVDVLLEQHSPPGVFCCVGNPPFKIAGQIIRHLRSIGVRRQIHLLPLSFQASTGRDDILGIGSGWRRTMVSSRRLPMMHRDGWEGPKTSPARDYAWFEFVDPRLWRHPSETTRFDWKDAI